MLNIALIEDDEFLNEDIKYFIEEYGHNLDIYTKADNVVENLENGKFKSYDTIVIDIMMPRRNIDIKGFPKDYETGEILYKKIRSIYPKKNIIIISAKDFRDMNIDFTKETNVHIARKPFDATASELISLINN